MNIAIIVEDAADGHAGVAHHARELTRWLEASGHDVTLWSGVGGGAPLIPGASVRSIRVRVNGNAVRFPAAIAGREARRRLRDSHLDILDLQLPCWPLLAAPLLAALPESTTAVATFHMATRSPALAALTRASRAGCGPSVSRLDGASAVSPTAARLARAALSREVDVIAPVVSTFPGADAHVRERGTIAFVGRLVPRKGVRALLRAFKVLLATERDCRLVIVGDGPDRARVTRDVSELGLRERVWMTGSLTDGERDRILAASDVICLPSLANESCGVGLVQALAVPSARVVAGMNPGYADLLDGRPDILVQATDPHALAERLARALDGRPSSAELSWRSAVVARFAAETIGPQVLAHYGRALLSSGRR